MENNELVETKKAHINRNIILAIIIVILIIIAAILFTVLKNPKKEEEITIQTFKNGDQSISLAVTSNFEFNIQHLDDYELSLYSTKYSSSIFISKVTSANIKNFKSFVEADKADYISKFSNISETSELQDATISGLQGYNYHFKYSNNMYVDVYLILKDEYVYIIDFNINREKEDLMNYIPTILDSIVL